MRNVDPLLKPLATPPMHFDTLVPLSVKLCIVVLLTVAAFLLDHTVSGWTLTHPKAFWDLANPAAMHGDLARELMMLEQFGQWTSTILIVIAVALLDRAGKRKALAIALACLATLALTHLLKDTLGRTRPYAYPAIGLAPGEWTWGGPLAGFTRGAAWGSFPSGHATAAFALAAALSWFYPRARGLFMVLATITAAQRVLHSAHFLSDVVVGSAIGVGVSRLTLGANLAGRWITAMPAAAKKWWLS